MKHPTDVGKIILRNEPGFRGECYSFVLVDRFTGYAGIFPLKSKTGDEVESSFRKFCGRRRPGIVIVGSDRAPEILAAIRALGFNSEPSAPRQAIHNPFAKLHQDPDGNDRIGVAPSRVES